MPALALVGKAWQDRNMKGYGEADGDGLKPPFPSFTFSITILPSPPFPSPPSSEEQVAHFLPNPTSPSPRGPHSSNFLPLSWLPALSPQIHSSFFHLKTSSPPHCYPICAPALLLTYPLTAKHLCSLSPGLACLPVFSLCKPALSQ